MNAVEKASSAFFNHLISSSLFTGILVPVIGLFQADIISPHRVDNNLLPALVSVLVIILNNYQKYELALVTYFVLFPFFICINYIME